MFLPSRCRARWDWKKGILALSVLQPASLSASGLYSRLFHVETDVKYWLSHAISTWFPTPLASFHRSHCYTRMVLWDSAHHTILVAALPHSLHVMFLSSSSRRAGWKDNIGINLLITALYSLHYMHISFIFFFDTQWLRLLWRDTVVLLHSLTCASSPLSSSRGQYIMRENFNITMYIRSVVWRFRLPSKHDWLSQARLLSIQQDWPFLVFWSIYEIRYRIVMTWLWFCR